MALASKISGEVLKDFNDRIELTAGCWCDTRIRWLVSYIEFQDELVFEHGDELQLEEFELFSFQEDSTLFLTITWDNDGSYVDSMTIRLWEVPN